MRSKSLWRSTMPFMLALGLVFAAIMALFGGQAQAADRVDLPAAAAIDRDTDPVVAVGSQFAALANAPIDELGLYVYDGSSWAPIPFQIDEVTSTGEFTATGNDDQDGGQALFDANDQLVFMAKDGGVQVTDTANWAPDPLAQTNPRVQVTGTDPLTGDTTYAYLYRSPTLQRSDTVYIAYDGVNEIITGESFVADLDSLVAIGLADLYLNGSTVDILDKQKVFLDGTVFVAVPLFGCALPLPIPISLTEVDLATTEPIEATIAGPVRLTSGTPELFIGAYGARLDIGVSININDLIGDIPDLCSFDLDVVNTSFDLNSPAVTGINEYRNNLGDIFAIDGVGDTVTSQPLADWTQVGSTNPTNDGMLVLAATDVTIPGSTRNLFRDNAANGQFGEFGVEGFSIGDGLINISLSAFITPPDTTGSQGQLYFDRAVNPIAATTAAQAYTGPLGPFAYISFDSATTVNGIAFGTEDVAVYDLSTGAVGRYFDGSDVGIAGDVNAALLLPNGNLVMSFATDTVVPGLPAGFTPLPCADIVQFIPSSIGENTAGNFVVGFDGSDVELDTECVDGVALAPGNVALISVDGAFSAQGVTGGDADFFELNGPTYGPNTSGTWDVFVDGSLAGLSDGGSEDVDGFYFDAGGNTLYISTLGAFTAAGGVSGDGLDIFTCAFTGCGIVLDGSGAGLTANINAVHIDLNPTAAPEDVDLSGVFR